VLAALVGVILGIGLLYLSGLPGIWIGREAWQSVIRDLGSLFVVTVAIGILWELWGQRALLDEVLAKVRLSEQIRAAGIVGITSDFFGLDWGVLLGTTKQLDIFFIRGQTWRHVYVNHLVELASKQQSGIRVILPDPEDDVSVREMANRFEISPIELKRQICEAKEFFENLTLKGCSPGGKVNLYFRRGTLQFSYYIMDNVAVVSLYPHLFRTTIPTGNPVPTLVASKGGWMFDWLQHEFDKMVEGADGRTRRLEPERDRTT
jgi:hypothetical protein